MQRYRNYGQLDDFPEVFGDVQFQYLDMRSDPATLPPGAMQVCENMRVDTNGLTVRGGIARQFLAATYIGQILFTGIYRPQGGYDHLAFVTSNKLWLFDPTDQSLTAYPFPTGNVFLPGDAIDAIQAGIGADSHLPLMTILHGLDNSVLSFDGTTVTAAAAIPRSEIGLFYQNRLAVNSDSQTLSISDFLDFATWTILNQFQIEKGGADYLVGLMAYEADYVLIGTRKKWFVAYFDPNISTSGYTGGLSTSSFLRLLTNEAGPVGREAMLTAAGMIVFVSDYGIYAFQPNLNNELVPLGRPLSADIYPVFSRMNASAASGACIAQFGYRLYFALPISDAPLAIDSITAVNQVTEGVTLPVTLPFLLSEGAIATIVTADAHNLSVGDQVQITGLASGGINGQWNVLSMTDEWTFAIAIPSSQNVVLGTRATAQRLAQRNNTICVLNTNNRDSAHPLGMWESIDTLPAGIYADWLRVADFGPNRRLWLIDANKGPCLYEEGSVDEVGDIQGGVALPFTLPVTLTATNFASVPIGGHLISRSYRWEGMLGSPHGTIAYRRRVRAAEVRLTAASGDSGTVTLRVRAPGRALMTYAQAFAGADTQPDISVTQRLSARGLEAELEFMASGGNPTLRALEVQVMKSGMY